MTGTETRPEDGNTSGSRSRKADGWLADTRTSYNTIGDSNSDYMRDALAGGDPNGFRPLPAGPASRRTAVLRFHVGDESRLKTQGYGGHPMKVYLHRRQPGQVAAWLRDAGFTVKAQMLLDLDQSVPGAILFACRRS